MQTTSGGKAPEINEKITKLIEESGKTKAQLAARLNILVNTLRAWFSRGIFPTELKNDLADFLGQPIEKIEAIGFHFFSGNKPRSKFNPGQISAKNRVYEETYEDTQETDVLHLIIVLHKLIAQGYLEAISRDEFIYLSILERKNKKPLLSDHIRKEIMKIRMPRR